MAKILLVEDEINIASFIERGLQEFGHEVRVANDGQAGWELVQQEDFQLLILDIIMPKMNGLQLCKQYRQTYGYQSPVIMLTALGTTDDIVNGLDAGADDMQAEEECFEITTTPENFGSVLEKLEEKGYAFLSAKVEMVPQNYVKLESEEDVKNMEKLIDLLEENDDVQNVYHNWEQD